MPLPASGPLSLNDIQGEFGGSNPISLSEYYAGGGLVPSGTSGTYGAVPSSGTISIQNFYGTSNVVITLTSQTGLTSIVNGVPAGETAVASYQIASNGKVFKIEGATTTEIEQWCTPTSAAGDYEVWATLNSSTGSGLSSGTTGSWLALTSNQTWTVTESTSGNLSGAELGMQIRKTGTGTVLATATINIEADVL